VEYTTAVFKYFRNARKRKELLEAMDKLQQAKAKVTPLMYVNA
jgi:hypothetical protein